MTDKRPSPDSLCIRETQFSLPGQESFYRGKVRDVYRLQDHLIMVASDRISAFDYVLPRAIPFKGAVLNGIAAHFLHSVSDIIPHWLEASPDPNVSIGKPCEPLKVEMVIRGYLAGHAWREYRSGKRILCGQTMPERMRESDKFPQPIITPSTKADAGHDEDISPEEIIRQGILDEETYVQMSDYTYQLFQRGTEMAAERGLILVDTKYEYGLYDSEITLIDEIHTPDSSRYYIANGYEERQERGIAQKQLSKEFVREWLMENGFHGRKGETIPQMSDDFIWDVSERYQSLYQKLTGRELDIHSFDGSQYERIEKNILQWIKTN